MSIPDDAPQPDDRSGVTSVAVAVVKKRTALWLMGIVGWWFVPILLVVIGIAMAAAGASQSDSCDASGGAAGGALTKAGQDAIPSNLIPIYHAAESKYGVPWNLLAGINRVETDFGRNLNVSSAGAIGWMQFMPATWEGFGVDANGDGRKDPYDPEDAIFGAANYLRASGAPGDIHKAVLAYNHAEWYYQEVIGYAKSYAQGLLTSDPVPAGVTGPIGPVSLDSCSSSAVPSNLSGNIRVDSSPGKIVPVPGFPGETVDNRILPNLMALVSKYKLQVTDCFSRDPVHALNGEHPLGLGCDLQPGTGGNWDLVDQLAAWAEPTQNNPIPPFRWVGYNGDANHGRGNHLHLSWDHAPAAPFTIASWVKVIG